MNTNEEIKKLEMKSVSNLYSSIRKLSTAMLGIRYVYGVPNVDKPCIVSFKPTKEGIKFLNVEKNDRCFLSLKREQIKSIVVEDQTSIEKRIGFKRMLLVGIFALAWKKRQVNPLTFFVVEFVDDVGLIQEMYIQTEHKDGFQTFNNLKYNIYKFWKEVDDLPNTEEVLSVIEKKYKNERAANKKQVNGCFAIILAIIFVIILVYLLK